MSPRPKVTPARRLISSVVSVLYAVDKGKSMQWLTAPAGSGTSVIFKRCRTLILGVVARRPVSFRIAARVARSVSVGAANVGSVGVEVNISPVLCVFLVSGYFITKPYIWE